MIDTQCPMRHYLTPPQLPYITAAYRPRAFLPAGLELGLLLRLPHCRLRSLSLPVRLGLRLPLGLLLRVPRCCLRSLSLPVRLGLRLRLRFLRRRLCSLPRLLPFLRWDLSRRLNLCSLPLLLAPRARRLLLFADLG